jgi:chloride channel protein, CIC family
VVESRTDRWVVGMLKRREAIAAYNRELLKRGISRKIPSIGQ